MKNITYLSLLALVMSGCVDDSFSRAYIDDEEKTTINGSITTTRNKAAANTQIGYEVTLEQSFDTDAVVTVASYLDCGAFDFEATTSYVQDTLTAGATQLSGIIQLAPESTEADIPYEGLEGCGRVYVSGISLIQEENDPVDDPYVAGDISTDLTILNFTPNNMTPQAFGNDGVSTGPLRIIMDWPGPYGNVNNLDLSVLNQAGFTLPGLTSQSPGRYEAVLFDNPDDNTDHPDGTYFLFVRYRFFEGVVPFYVHITHADGTVEFYEFVPVEGLETNVYIEITKTTDPETNAVTYTTKPFE